MTKRNATILLTILILTIVGYSFYRAYTLNKLYGTNKKTIGLVYNQGKNIVYYYNVNGVKLKGIIPRSQNYYLGGAEEYYIYYDSIDPKESVIDFTKPHIDSQFFSQATSLPINTSFAVGKQFVQFRYIVNNDTLSRSVYYEFTRETMHTKNKTFRVLYKKTDPSVAYINFGQPL